MISRILRYLCLSRKGASSEDSDFRNESSSASRWTLLETRVRDFVSKHWISFCGLSLLLVIICLWLIPKWQVSGLSPRVSPDAVVNLENTCRVTLAQIIGGALLLAGLFFNGIRLSLARQGQITERFTRTTEQLGSDKLDVRVGAIYAFEAIALDSDAFRWPTIEILAAFIREHSSDIRPSAIRPSNDVHTALSVIGRLGKPGDFFCGRRVELRDCDLSNANLRGGSFRGAVFSRTILNGAFCENCDPRNTEFISTSVKMANFSAADLRASVFEEVDANDADFSDADLCHAKIGRSDFRGASFGSASLKMTILGTCRFEGADLSEVQGEPFPLIMITTDERTRMPDWLDRESLLKSPSGREVLG
jgi:hypothetical protein